MPFTPFHFGPSACASLPVNRYIDFPVFLLANVAIDIEPLLVMTFHLSYPLHGFAHTLVGGAVVGLLCGLLGYFARGSLAGLMKLLRLPYTPTLGKYLAAGVLGSWFHVLLDAPLYGDIRPLYPLSSENPLLWSIQSDTMYTICSATILPASILYLAYCCRLYRRKDVSVVNTNTAHQEKGP